jgi:type IV pilus assembly protein PilM
VFERERLTLSIEANEVRLLVSQGRRILRWGSAPLPAGTMRNGQVAQPTGFGQIVRRLAETLDAPRRRAVVGLSGQGSLVRILSLPAVPTRLLGEAVRRTARRELPLPLDELYLSWQVLGNRDAAQLRIFTLGTPREAVDNCVVGLHSADVRPVAMDLKPLALVRAANLSDVLLAGLEETTMSVVLVREFVPYIARSIALPGEADRPLDERADDLVAEIQRTLDFYNSTTAAEHPPWTPVICLTGALGGERKVRSRIGATWSLVEPELSVSPPQDLPLLPYLANIGLVMKRLT